MSQPPIADGSQSRKLRALLAGGVVLGLGVAATLAAWSDGVWAGAGFSTGTFGIESALTNSPESYATHSASPLDLTIDTPISLKPGEVAYSGFYIRRTPGTEDYADVRMSGPTGATESSGTLWNDHLTFVARVAPVALTGTTCGEHMLGNPAWRPLYYSGTFASPNPVPDGTFTLGEPLAGNSAGEPYMVCFQFTLNSNVVAQAPEANGESVHPTWTLTAESRQP